MCQFGNQMCTFRIPEPFILNVEIRPRKGLECWDSTPKTSRMLRFDPKKASNVEIQNTSTHTFECVEKVKKKSHSFWGESPHWTDRSNYETKFRSHSKCYRRSHAPPWPPIHPPSLAPTSSPALHHDLPFTLCSSPVPPALASPPPFALLLPPPPFLLYLCPCPPAPLLPPPFFSPHPPFQIWVMSEKYTWYRKASLTLGLTFFDFSQKAECDFILTFIWLFALLYFGPL